MVVNERTGFPGELNDNVIQKAYVYVKYTANYVTIIS